MTKLLSWTKPIHFVFAGRVVALLAGFVLGVGYVADGLTPLASGVLTWVLAVSLMLGAPKQRGAELIRALAICISAAELLSIFPTSHFDAWRWGYSMIALVAAIYPISESWTRRQANAHPGKTLAELDQRVAGKRSGIMPTKDEKLEELRGEPAGTTEIRIGGFDATTQAV